MGAEKTGGDLRTNLDAPPKVGFRHNPALDGIRGIGICIVMLGHFAAGLSIWAGNRLFGLSLTIDWFFVLSGYLITALLLEEWSKTHNISMRNFYVRRGLRLLPALYVFLAIFVGLALFTTWIPVSHKQAIGEAGAAAFYVYPLVLIAKGDKAFLFHLWTLSVEEWFYFLWPAFLLVVGLRPGVSRRLKLVIAVLGTVVVGAFMLRTIGSYDGFSRLVYALRPDSLAWGALLAIFMRWLSDVRTPTIDRVLSIVGPLGVVGALYFTWFANYPRQPGVSTAHFHDMAFRSWNYRLGILCAVLFIFHFVNKPDGRLGRILSFRALTYLGILSYAIYLWHQPIFLTLNGYKFFNSDPSAAGHVTRSVPAMWGIGLLCAGLGIGVAVVSRKIVELPALRQKKRFEIVKYAGQR
jgi:peptidoglycan/LPS O-acetylase OafA/YrhL